MKKVLSLILKISKLEVDLIVVVSRFQSLGAAQLNDDNDSNLMITCQMITIL